MASSPHSSLQFLDPIEMLIFGLRGQPLYDTTIRFYSLPVVSTDLSSTVSSL